MIQKRRVHRIKVRLNGTGTNPYERLGLIQNPFPQLGKAEFNEEPINRLGGMPIPKGRAAEYIREVLTGFSEEFIQLCINNYRAGKLVTFEIEFPAE